MTRKAVPVGKKAAAASPTQESQMELEAAPTPGMPGKHLETQPEANSERQSNPKASTSTHPSSTRAKIDRKTSIRRIVTAKANAARKALLTKLVNERNSSATLSSIKYQQRQLRLLREEERRKKHRKRDGYGYNHFGVYLYKVLKEIHPDLGISNKAMSIMNSLMHDMFSRLALEASRLCAITKGRTLTSRDFQTAARLLIPGELAIHAVSDGTKALTSYINARQAEHKKR